MPLPVVAGVGVSASLGIEPMDLADNEAEGRGYDFSPAPPTFEADLSPSQESTAAAANFVVNNSTLDLDSYASNYSGFARIQRLLFVADHCPSHKIDALSLVLKYVKSDTLNVSMYQKAHSRLVAAAQEMGVSFPPAPGSSNGVGSLDLTNDLPYGQAYNGVANICGGQKGYGVMAYDQPWVENTMKRAQLKTEKLDTDLKHYKSNSIKESIRRGQDDLGEHYLDMGDLTNALKCFSRARDYCTSTKHIIAMCFNVIKVSVYTSNWSLVASYVLRAQSSGDGASQPRAVVGSKDEKLRAQCTSKLKAAAGLAELAGRNYKQAAKNFLQCYLFLVSFDHLDYSEVISANNIAAYGALCALATYDRKDLQKSVIASTTFKQFLELEPQMYDLLKKFNASEYAKCLELLDELRDNLLLDVYLAAHVDMLYCMIRKRGLVQYFSPYLSADMKLMATAFNTSFAKLEDEVTDLILDGKIKGRIDSNNKILIAKDADQRSGAYDESLLVGQIMERRARTLLLRAAMHKAKVCVKAPQTPRETSNRRNAQNMDVAQGPSGQNSPQIV